MKELASGERQPLFAMCRIGCLDFPRLRELLRLRDRHGQCIISIHIGPEMLILSWLKNIKAGIVRRMNRRRRNRRRLGNAFHQMNFTRNVMLPDTETLEDRTLLAANFEFGAAAFTGAEDGGSGTFPTLIVKGTVTEPNVLARTLSFTISGGSASNNGVDYSTNGGTASTGTFIVPLGDYSSGTSFSLLTKTAEMTAPTITIINDNVIEGDEDFNLQSTNQTTELSRGDANGDFGIQDLTNHTIEDNDTATLQIVSGQSVTEEGGGQTVQVSLTTSNGAGGTATLGALVSVSAEVAAAVRRFQPTTRLARRPSTSPPATAMEPSRR